MSQQLLDLAFLLSHLIHKRNCETTIYKILLVTYGLHAKLFVKSDEENLDSNDTGAVRYGLLAFTSTCSPQKKL